LNHPTIQAARRHILVGIGILAGLKNQPVPMARIQDQVKIVRNFKFSGISFFFYETLWMSNSEIERERVVALRSTFIHPRQRPTL